MKRYESGTKAVRCEKCGVLIAAEVPRYWDPNTNKYHCELCAKMPQASEKEPSKDDDFDALVKYYKDLASTLKISDPDALMRGAITLFLQKRGR